MVTDYDALPLNGAHHEYADIIVQSIMMTIPVDVSASVYYLTILYCTYSPKSSSQNFHEFHDKFLFKKILLIMNICYFIFQLSLWVIFFDTFLIHEI